MSWARRQLLSIEKIVRHIVRIRIIRAVDTVVSGHMAENAYSSRFS